MSCSQPGNNQECDRDALSNHAEIHFKHRVLNTSLNHLRIVEQQASDSAVKFDNVLTKFITNERTNA